MIQIKLNMRGIPASRPRVTKHGTYNSPKYANYKEALRLKLMPFRSMGNVNLRVELSFYFVPSKTAHRNKYNTPRYDADNLAKGVLDAMNGILFDDDVQVEELEVTKKYGAEDVIFITIKELC